MCPLAEADLADELGSHPDNVSFPHLGHLRDGLEGARLTLEGPQLPQELLDFLLVEARTAVSDPDEIASPTDGEDERAEAGRSPPLALGVARNQKLLPLLGLHLEPVSRPFPEHVDGARFFGDHTLETLLASSLHERQAIVEALGEPDRLVPPVEQGFETLLTHGQRQVEEQLTLDPESVEGVVDEVRAPLLHLREARAPVLVESADLAVEDGVRRSHCLSDLLGETGKAGCEVVAVSARQLDVAARDRRNRPVAVPLDLVNPTSPPR